MRKVIQIIAYIAIGVIIAYSGYQVGSSNRCLDCYERGMEDLTKRLMVMVAEGKPFIFAGMEFIPLKGGKVKVTIRYVGLKDMEANISIATDSEMDLKVLMKLLHDRYGLKKLLKEVNSYGNNEDKT